MNVKCPKCGADYNVQSDRIPLSGIDMKCSKCLHSFHVAAGGDDTIATPASTRVGLKGVTFLGGGERGGTASSGYFIRSVRGQVMGPFEPNVILQMLRTSQLTGAETLSRDKQVWEPLASVEEFGDFIAMRQDRGAGSTRFLGRPGSTAREGGARPGGALVVPPPAVEEEFGFEEPGFSVEFDDPAGAGFDFDGGGLPGADEFSLEMPPRGGELSGFALSDVSAELPTPLGGGGRYDSPEMDLGFALEDDFEGGGFGGGFDGGGFGQDPGFDAELPVPAVGRLDHDLLDDAELPVPVGDELPDPFMDDVELPVLASRKHGSDAELPIPRASRRSDAELPIPRASRRSDAELPVSRGGFDMDAELPVPVGFDEPELPAPAGRGVPELPTSVRGGATFGEMLGKKAELPRAARPGAELPRSAGLEELPVDFEAELPVASAALPASAGAAPLGTFGRREGAELPRARQGHEADDDLFDDNLGDDPFGVESFGGAELPPFEMEDDPFAEREDMTYAGGKAYQSAFGVGDGGESTVGVNPEEYHSVMGLTDQEGVEPADGYWGDELNQEAKVASAAPLPPPAAHRVLDTRPREEAAPRGRTAAPPQPVASAPVASTSTVQVAAEEGNVRGTQARAASSSNKMLLGAIVFLAVALVLIGGMILGQTEMGYFGINLLTGDGGKTSSGPVVDQLPTEVVAPPSTKADFSQIQDDTHEVLAAFIADKTKALSARPDDPGLKGELMVGLVLYLSHYPTQEEYKRQAEALAPQLAGSDVEGARLGRGAFAVLHGKESEARAELEPMAEGGEQAYMAHLLLGLVDLLASRVEGAAAMAPPPEDETPPADAAGSDADAGATPDASGDPAAADGEPKPDADAGAGDQADNDGGVEGDAAGNSDEFDMTEEILEETKGSKRRKRSLTHLEEAAKLEPRAPAPHFFMAMMDLAVGEDKAAIGHLDHAIKASEGHVPGLLERARLAYLGADLKNAETAATPVIEKLAPRASVRERSMAYQIVGQVHVARRESEPAIAMLTESLKVDPTNVAALKELGQEFFRNQQYAEALNYFTTNAQLSRSDPEVMLSIVKSHIGLEQYDQAVQMLEQGAQSFPTDAQFPYYLGRIHDQRSNWFEAQQNYRKALAIDPGYAKARVRLAILLLRDNRRSEASEQLAETEKLGVTNNAEMAVDVGTAYMLLGEEDKGLALLRRAMRLNASNLDARLALAQHYLNKGDAKRAMEMLGPFVDSKTEDIQLTLLLADAFREAGQYERSIEQLDRLIDRDPKNANYRFKRGLAYFAWKNFDTAREQFLKAYSLDPSFQRAYFYAGRVSFEQKDYAAAMKIFRQVLDEEPGVGEYRYYLGYALEKNGNLTQALEEYNNVERYSPTYGEKAPDLYYRRGRILQLEGNYRAAKQDLVRVLQNDPKHLGALLGLGDTLFDERKYEDAIELYEKALAERDDLPRAHYQVGRAYAYLNRRAEAVKALERAIELGLEEPKAYETLGYLHRDNGATAQARRAFEKYLELVPDASNKKDIEKELRRLGG